MKTQLAFIFACLLSLQFPQYSYPENAGDTKSISEKTIQAQTRAINEKPKLSAKSLRDDISIPDSPAFTILSITPQNVTNPTTVRDLATALINGVDRNGNFQSGVAIDASVLNLYGDSVNLKQYNDSYLSTVWFSTQLSFATVKGVNDEDKSFRIGSGIRMTLFDSGDPRRENSPYIQCATKILEDNPMPRLEDFLDESGLRNEMSFHKNELKLVDARTNKLRQTKTEDRAEIELLKTKREFHENAKKRLLEKQKEARSKKGKAIEEYNTKTVKKLLTEESKSCRSDKNWNRSRWVVAFAPSWISPTGDSGNLNWNGAGYWTSIVIGPDLFGFRTNEKDIEASLFSDFQLILHARYRSNEMTPDALNIGSFINQDTANVGAQVQYGITSSFILFGEGSLVHSNPDIGFTDNYYQFSAGLNFKLQDDLWLKLTYSGSSDRSNQPDRGSVLANLQWAFGQSP